MRAATRATIEGRGNGRGRGRESGEKIRRKEGVEKRRKRRKRGSGKRETGRRKTSRCEKKKSTTRKSWRKIKSFCVFSRDFCKEILISMADYPSQIFFYYSLIWSLDVLCLRIFFHVFKNEFYFP